MKKFLKLAKIQISEFMNSSMRTGSKKIQGKILLLVIFSSILAASGIYASGIYLGLPNGYKDLTLYLMSAASILVIFVISISTAQGQLFQFKDFDRLMSWPISRTQVFLAKITSFVSLNMLYQIVFIIPALIVYGINEHMGILFYVFGIVGSFFLSFIPLSFASLIALGIRRIAGNGRFKTLFVNLGTFVLMAGILFLSFSVPSLEETAIPMEFFNEIYKFLELYLFPVFWYVKGTVDGNLVYLLGSILACTAILVLFIFFFSKTFISINSRVQEGYKVKNFKLGRTNSNSALSALFKKELMKVFANSMYFFNLAIGQVMLIVGGVVLVINKSQVDTMLAQFGITGLELKSTFFGLICSAICLFALMTPTSSVSISLEGKQWWITKTIPVKTEIIFISKALVNAVIIWIPSAIGFILVSIGFSFSIIEILLGLLLIFFMGIFVGFLGLSINMNFPKLEFDREILVIKQSMSSFISIMGGIVLGALIIFLYINLTEFMSSSLIITIFTLGIILLDIGLWLYLKSVGIRKFKELY